MSWTSVKDIMRWKRELDAKVCDLDTVSNMLTLRLDLDAGHTCSSYDCRFSYLIRRSLLLASGGKAASATTSSLDQPNCLDNFDTPRTRRNRPASCA